MQKLNDAINEPIAEWVKQCTETSKKHLDQNSQFMYCNQALQVIERAKRKHESVLMSQWQVRNTTGEGGDAAD